MFRACGGLAKVLGTVQMPKMKDLGIWVYVRGAMFTEMAHII